MLTRARLFLAAILLVLAAPLALGAQQMMQPTPLAADAPTAVRARAAADLLLAGDAAKLAAYVREHGAASLTGRATLDAELAQLLDLVKAGARAVVRIDALGDTRVGIALGASATAEPERAILVGLEKDAPHRITGLRVVEVRMGG